MRDLSVARSKYVLPPAHWLCGSDETALSSSPQRRDCCFDARCERRPTSRSSASRRTARSDCARPQWGAGRALWCGVGVEGGGRWGVRRLVHFDRRVVVLWQALRDMSSNRKRKSRGSNGNRCVALPCARAVYWLWNARHVNHCCPRAGSSSTFDLNRSAPLLPLSSHVGPPSASARSASALSASASGRRTRSSSPTRPTPRTARSTLW